MHKWLWLLLLAAMPLHAQIVNPSIQYVSVAPSGACSQAPPVQVLNSSGAIYTCNNGTWGVQGGGTSLSGTANQIDVTDGVVSLDPGVATCLGGTSLAIDGTSYSHCYVYVKLSTTTPPVNTSGTTWQYTLASPISSGAATYLQSYAPTPVISGYTGGAAGNNVTAAITAATTTTISVTNASGTTANTGTPNIAFNTFEVRANLCIFDAGGKLNGNTNSICDSTGEPGTVNQYGPITVQGSEVVWRLAPGLYDEVQNIGTSQWAITQLAGTAIICEGAAQNSGCQINAFNTTNNAAGLYTTGSTTGYRLLDGVWFKSIHGGTLSSGNVCQIEAGYDGSTWQNMQCIDDATTNVGNGTVAVIGGNTLCCHTQFINDTFDSEWGQTALSITSPQFDQTNAIDFHNTTVNSHGPSATGNPNLLIADPTNKQVNITFSGILYMEGQTATMTSPWIQVNGARALSFDNITAFAVGGTASATTAPLVAIGATNGFDTNLNIGNVVEWQGNSTNYWSWPGTVVEQYNTTTDCASAPCAVAVTDANGNSPGYHSRTTQFNNVTVGGNIIDKGLGTGTSPVCPNGTGGALTTTGCTATGTSSSFYAGTATGSVNVLAATLSPVPANYAAIQGIPVTFLPNLANTTSTPTLNLNSLGAITIVKGSSTALSNGDLATTAIATVIYNGTNFVLQNPQVNITQTGASGTSFGVGQIKTNSIVSNNAVTTSVQYSAATNTSNSSTSNLGTAILYGPTNTSTGAAGSASVQAGANSSSGQQGFANVIQSFTIAAATTVGHVMEMTSTADRVVDAALGSVNNVGIATTVGGTAAQLYVASSGKVLVVFDGTPVVGDEACAPPTSTGTAGLAHDNVLVACPAGQKLGVITGQVSGTGSGATATVLLQLGS